ncbi:VanZ family protein [Gemella bergeri]
MFIKILYRKYLSLSFLIIICIVIFLFSHQAGFESSKISDNLFIRKLGHFSEYFILGFSAFNYFTNIFSKNLNKINISKIAFTGFSFSVLYAISDEFHQTFIADRDGNIKDVFIDSLGVFVGIILAILIFRLCFRKES